MLYTSDRKKSITRIRNIKRRSKKLKRHKTEKKTNKIFTEHSFSPQEKKRETITGFIKKVGSTYTLESDAKPYASYVILKSKEKLIEEALAVARKLDRGCEITKVFPAISTLNQIKEFVIAKYGLPRRFGKNVEDEIKLLERKVSTKNRIDLTHIRHVTIDGENAKDFDDAVYVEKTDGHYRLYVSIADVGSYVPKGSALDKEANMRGMSVYFPDSVIPMLPAALSDDLCSLKPKKNRLCFSVIMELDKKGNVKRTRFEKSVIRSVKRLTYEEVELAIIEKDKQVRKRLKGILKDLELMKELTEVLLERRSERGSLDFDLPEPEIIIDLKGAVKNILRSKRLFSHRIIEEFMILANRTVAEFLERKKIAVLFRVHEEPEHEKLRVFEKFCKSFGIPLHRNKNGIKRLQAILESAKNKFYEFILNRLLLRSMKQAKYSAVNRGHYGLGLVSYLHFTSPIRRYPDLVCHRILEAVISGKKSPYTYEELDSMASYLSERERIIMEIEREIEDRVRILFMKDNLGEEYSGIITHIAPFGFFVELFDVFVEGVVLFSDMVDDHYEVKREGTVFAGKRRKKIFTLGDIVRVKVVSADVERKVLRFVLTGKN
ncbi:MAG: VacB/RNase II family 3'-5' exoribonuclease [Desulfobacterota bacterium]|nr:VacB/RNase II family 3'-5' exoribonuclease [Thermodesulfobacteriota bacterium]MDW8002235.1 VacB/RNase II family 3'-5' exoribonuclease [Deltaproteobacteria bacterium]